MEQRAVGHTSVLAVIGTRPEAIKIAPLVLAARGRPTSVRIALALTGQHGAVVTEALSAFGLEPDHVLECPRSEGGLPELLATLLASLGRLVRSVRPAAVVVQGDTSSALAGALAAFYEGVPVVHLEAGLLTSSIDAPFPEEAHRRVISDVARLHLAPTAGAASNLFRRGVHRDHVVVTGNTVVDSLLHATTVDRTPLAGALSRLVEGDRTVVVTAHRRESWGEPMAEVARALLTLVERHRDIRVILVKHPNPVVGEAMARHVERSDRIVCVDPLPYQQFVKLLAASCLVLTDSGGLQEELPSLGIPLVVLRAETERSEGLTAGTAILAGTTHDRIVELASAALCAPRNDAVPANPFGDGAAGERALDAIGWMLGVGPRPADFSAQVGRQARVVIGAPTPPTRLEPPSVPVPQRVVLAGLEE